MLGSALARLYSVVSTLQSYSLYFFSFFFFLFPLGSRALGLEGLGLIWAVLGPCVHKRRNGGGGRGGAFVL